MLEPTIMRTHTFKIHRKSEFYHISKQTIFIKSINLFYISNSFIFKATVIT